MSEEKEQETKVSSELLKRAVDFHGHLGPFLEGLHEAASSTGYR
ncbi:MAG: hypothetical protein ACTSRF_08975 [Candidatus Freyarchaeota archaeon]